MTSVVHVEGVHKRFRDASRPRTWKDALVTRRPREDGVQALRDVDLDVPTGATMGVVGANGAGKSTLLRVIAGVLDADAGTVEVQGSVGSMLDLGAGFHPELTGRESAVLAAVISGRTRRAARRSVDWVCEFAGLDGFMDSPLRTYSSGMQARLAFAIATEQRPEVLLVDEVLAVGDVAFQQRCIGRLQEFQRQGTTSLLVSHDADLVRVLCDRVLWLDAGQVVADGSTDEVLGAYLGDAPPSPVASAGISEVLRAVSVLDARGQRCQALPVGAPLTVAIAIEPLVEPVQIAVRLVRADGLLSVDTSTTLDPGVRTATLELGRLDLAPGSYDVEVGVYDSSWRQVLDERCPSAQITVIGTASRAASLAPPATWSTGER